MKKFMLCLSVLLLCFAMIACGNDENQSENEKPGAVSTTAATQEMTDPATEPTESIPTQPAEPKPTEPKPTEPKPTEPTQSLKPTLPDEGQDPGGFGPIF